MPCSTTAVQLTVNQWVAGSNPATPASSNSSAVVASPLHGGCRGFESLFEHLGKVAEWFKALVLKTKVVKATVSSNLTFSVYKP